MHPTLSQVHDAALRALLAGRLSGDKGVTNVVKPWDTCCASSQAVVTYNEFRHMIAFERWNELSEGCVTGEVLVTRGSHELTLLVLTYSEFRARLSGLDEFIAKIQRSNYLARHGRFVGDKPIGTLAGLYYAPDIDDSAHHLSRMFRTGESVTNNGVLVYRRNILVSVSGHVIG